MTILVEKNHTAEFLLSEANGYRSREVVTINATAGKLEAGTLLAAITSANAGVVTADGGNTGNGAFGTVTVGNDAITGTYGVEITEAESDGGVFEVTDPFGNSVGGGEVGVMFEGGGLSFTIADGATDFVKGDKWTIAVNAGIGEWVVYDDDGSNDGRRQATGILYGSVDATLADAQAVAIVRDAEVAAARLVGLDDNGAADLAALGIIVR